jgi:hypothetical protein
MAIEQQDDQTGRRRFNPNDHLTQLKNGQGSQDYLPVQWRLVWFRENCPQGTIDTQEMEERSNGSQPPITEQQITSIERLAGWLELPEAPITEGISYIAAKKLIEQLGAELKEKRKQMAEATN